MTLKAKQEIEESEVVIGYKTYIKLIQTTIPKDADVITTGMRQEVERAEVAVTKALEGKRVVAISGGDPGVYGIAGLIIKVAELRKADVDIEIIPGVTAAVATAAILGAPIMGDFAIISLSDILTPWNIIEKRLTLATKADFVIIIYNPKSQKRRTQLIKAHKILSNYRSPKTPVGIVRKAKREQEKSIITTLEKMLNYEIDMATTIIVGNSTTHVLNDRMVTPRGYNIEVENWDLQHN
ncbi:MAG: precorrin-3B C(17)-methyltransferase [Candidatus Methylarchaceae archaeon HK02M1]|nr:precorrin-3B C(17)-methyltransferase [Candidatus Methylarchaceae archaeon HK01M]MCP8312543.1 precorrin-3B C(17)-methyltransferase [Candidatus Methylarchaceae archaeon HK02M1]